ncbi:MAG: GNAT family N-acetyltransferase [Roseburia sp.]|nr:GNAT family N-acetyltransferase [Roseburia sp.]
MIVNPKKQRSGIGKELVDTLKDYSKENGLAGIVLYTHEQAPAKRFYEKNGFQLSEGVICMYWV